MMHQKNQLNMLFQNQNIYTVQEGDYVEVGDVLVDGSAVPHDILRIKGCRSISKLSNKRGSRCLQTSRS